MTSDEFREIYNLKDEPDWVKTIGFWIKGNKKITLTRGYHHDCIVENPKTFLDEKTISEFCKAYNLESIESLKDDWDFQHEQGPVHEELINLVLQNGWIRVRTSASLTDIACYDLNIPKYRKAVIDVLMDNIENFGKSDCVTVLDYIGHGKVYGQIEDVIEELLGN